MKAAQKMLLCELEITRIFHIASMFCLEPEQQQLPLAEPANFLFNPLSANLNVKWF